MRRFESCRGRRPVLRTFACGGLGSLAAEIVEGGCDIEGAAGRLVDDVELQRVEQRPQFALGRRVERAGEDRQAVEQRGDVGQRGRLCRRGSGQCHQALAPSDDGVLQFRDPLTDTTAQTRGHVVGFAVHELAADPAFEVCDLGFDLAGALSRWGRPFRLGGGVEGVPPVVGALGAEEGGGEEREQRVVEPLLV